MAKGAPDGLAIRLRAVCARVAAGVQIPVALSAEGFAAGTLDEWRASPGALQTMAAELDRLAAAAEAGMQAALAGAARRGDSRAAELLRERQAPASGSGDLAPIVQVVLPDLESSEAEGASNLVELARARQA